LAGLCCCCIRFLPGDSGFAREASPKTTLFEESREVRERRDIDVRIAERQISTRGAVKHPAWHYDHHARRRLDVAQTHAGPNLAVKLADGTAEQRVPTIMNLDFLPNTGRMNGRSPSGAVMRSRGLCAARQVRGFIFSEDQGDSGLREDPFARIILVFPSGRFSLAGEQHAKRDRRSAATARLVREEYSSALRFAVRRALAALAIRSEHAASLPVLRCALWPLADYGRV
jgi:hypothetical protein